MKKNIFISILIIISFHFSYGQINKQDSLALVALYNSTDGPNWKTNNNWLSKKRVPYWSGISVISNRVTSIKLNANNLTGTIPSEIGNLTKLTSLNLYLNNLTGTIPPEIGNLTELTVLLLNNNNLSGTIPSEIGNLTALTSLQLYKNTLTGSIPSGIGNITKLKKLHLSENNLSGAIPSGIGKLTDLETIYLSYNNLTGIIPPEIGNLTKLMALFLGENNLSDPIPSEIGNITTLYSLGLANNNFEGPIPPEIVNPPNLGNLYLTSNFLNYSDLEPLTSKDIDNFWYAPQKKDTSELQYLIVEDSITFTMDTVGGHKTLYQWFKNDETLKYLGSTKTNSFTIAKDEDIQSYYCRTISQNIRLKDLHFVGIAPQGTIEDKDCWQTGQLTFCLNSGKWEKAGKDKIKTSNIISINDFLFFDGTMTIDTLNLDMEADGDFYALNIPLPGGGTIGKYLISSGKHNLKLLGKDGAITNFLNSKLDKSAKLFGVALKVDNLQLIKRSDTLGINIACTANIPGLVVGCDNNPYRTSEIALRNLEVTNKGIDFFGFSAENLGIEKLGACLNKFTYDYDPKKDILVAGAEIALPFIPETSFGAGVRIEKGEVDSIAWLVDTDIGAIPISPPLTFGVSGFEGHIASINKPNIDIKIKGTFSDLIAPSVYKLKLGGNVIWPKKFILSGDGYLLKPPLLDFPYQLKGDVEMELDVGNDRLYTGFRGVFGTLDDKIYLIDGVGNFNISLHEEKPPEFSGNLEGLLTLPKLSEDPPFNWLNTIFDFPIEGKTENDFTHNYPNLVTGKVSVKTVNYGPYALKYVLDISKTWYQSGYIRFPDYQRIEEFAVTNEKSGLLAGNVIKTFTVPENNEFGVLEIKCNEKAPTSSITSPAGKKYSESSATDNVLYSESSDKKEAFWTLFAADPGDWSITLENPAQNDSVVTHFQLKEKEFKFSMNQTGSTVTINWDVALVEEGQTVNIMLDDNDVGFDGFRITDGEATLGSLSFTLDENTPDCNYNLFVQLVDEFSVVQAYAKDKIDNPLASLAPPTNFNSTYISETSEINFEWDASPSSEITGYILSITDELGNDSVYAILNSFQTSISLFIEDFENKSAKIESYNYDWKIGCPSSIDDLTTSIENDFRIEDTANRLNIYPNPTTGNLSIRYFVSEDSKCEIRIFDIQGRQIAQPLSEYRTAGFHQLEFQYKSLPNGLYIIKYVNNNHVFTSKSILNNL